MYMTLFLPNLFSRIRKRAAYHMQESCIGLYMTLNCVALVRFGRNFFISLFLPNLTGATQLSVDVSAKEVHNLHSFETWNLNILLKYLVIFHPTDYWMLNLIYWIWSNNIPSPFGSKLQQNAVRCLLYLAGLLKFAEVLSIMQTFSQVNIYSFFVSYIYYLERCE